MEFLSEVDGEVDLVEARSAGQRRTLPPSLGAVDGVACRMLAPLVERVVALEHVRRIVTPRVIAVVTHLSLDEVDVRVVLLVEIGTDQLAVQLRRALVAARGRGRDVAPFGEVEVRRVQDLASSA